MTNAEARQYEFYQSVRHDIPSWEGIARGMMKDYSDPVEFEAHGFESIEDVAQKIEDAVESRIMKAPVPNEAEYILEQEASEAKRGIYPLVDAEFPEMIEGTEIQL